MRNSLAKLDTKENKRNINKSADNQKPGEKRREKDKFTEIKLQ